MSGTKKIGFRKNNSRNDLLANCEQEVFLIDYTLFYDFFSMFHRTRTICAFCTICKLIIMGKIWEVEGGGTDDKFC